MKRFLLIYILVAIIVSCVHVVNAQEVENRVSRRRTLTPTLQPTAIPSTPAPTTASAPQSTPAPSSEPTAVPTIQTAQSDTTPTPVQEHSSSNTTDKSKSTVNPSATPTPPPPTPTSKPVLGINTKKNQPPPAAQILGAPSYIMEHQLPKDFYSTEGLSAKGTGILLSLALALITGGVLLIKPSLTPRFTFTRRERNDQSLGTGFAQI